VVGDTVVSTVRTYLRAITFVDRPDLIWSTGFAVLHPRPTVNPRYLYYLCRSEPVIQEIVSRSVGVSYPAINPSDIMDISVAIPPSEEQRAIVGFLDGEVQRISALIGGGVGEGGGLLLRQIALLRERGQALISEVVTGQRRIDAPPPVAA